MSSNGSTQSPSHQGGSTVRGMVAIIFRWQRLILTSFACLLGLITIALITQPNVYEAEMKILVRHNRLDPLVTAEAGAVTKQDLLTEQDLSSEAELVKSRDLLEKAAVACNLPEPPSTSVASFPVLSAFAGSAGPAGRKPNFVHVSEAVRELNDRVQAVPLRNSNLISVTFVSANPVLASCILNNLADLYLDKHLTVHRPGGTYEFFRQQADRYKARLDEIETEVSEFGATNEMFFEGVQKELAVRKLSEYNASLIDTSVAIAEVEARINALEKRRASVRPTQRREVRTVPNPQLAQLKATAVDLEMKRTELLQKYVPTYRPVEEVEKQIQQIQKAIAAAEEAPQREETVGVDPEHEWARLELAKARSELAALRAGTPARQDAVQTYREMAFDLDRKDIERQDLVRQAKVTAETYELYLRKEEEARMGQELDKRGILNVAIAEEATIPVLPQPAFMPMKLSFAAFLAGLVSLGIAFAADRWDRTLRTPAEVQAYLGVPVIASIPALRSEDNERS